MQRDYTRIFYYVPNLIGYTRVAFSILSFIIFEKFPALFLFLYIVSFVLDAADGHAARYFNQCSRFGAVLDMVTDRFSTMALNMVLSRLYPKLFFLFVFLNILDFTSHWMRQFSMMMIGQSSHKNVNPDHPKLLQVYYSNKNFMCALCLGQEFSYIMMYIFCFWNLSQYLIVKILFSGVLVPLCALKQWTNVIQLTSAAVDLTKFEFEKDEHHKKN